MNNKTTESFGEKVPHKYAKMDAPSAAPNGTPAQIAHFLVHRITVMSVPVEKVITAKAKAWTSMA